MGTVLIVAFDGLQPAQVRPDLMPNLAEFAIGGVTFRSHHPVFPTVTRTNVASLVTGCYPGHHGVAANTLVMRDFDPSSTIAVLAPEMAQVARKTGRVLLRPTLADILHDSEREYVAVGVGTSGNAYVHNPNARRCGGATIHTEFCLPAGLHEDIVGRFGPWPEEVKPNSPQMAHAVRVLTEYVLAEREPAVSLLWLSEPDSAQHAQGVGSELSNQAVGSADKEFGRILDWLEESGRTSETDVLVVSDHGYSTISAVWDVESAVREAGFAEGGQQDGVILATNGGSVLFYVDDGQSQTCERLAEWLTAQPWCGALLASEAAGAIDGTLPASPVGTDGPRAPELTMAFAWDSRTNAAGYAGFANSSSGVVGKGMHGSMSRHEMGNVLLARGPSFKQGTDVDAPSGNVDIAPTVLRILGLEGAADMDGRVLDEALADGGPHPQEVEWSTETFSAQRGDYRQEITISRVGTTSYVDGGNATDHDAP